MFLGFVSMWKGVLGVEEDLGCWNCNVPLFGRLQLGGSHAEKRVNNRKKFFASNSVVMRNIGVS